MGMCRVAGFRDDAEAESEQHNADGHVHEKDVRPGLALKQSAEGHPVDYETTQDGACCRGHAYHPAPDAHGRATLFGWENAGDDGQRGRHHHRPPQALDGAEGDKPTNGGSRPQASEAARTG